MFACVTTHPQERNTMLGSFPWNKTALAATLLLCLGCAGPPFASRPVQTEPSWFVQLDSPLEATSSSDHLYDHPATWTLEELSAILSRLLLEEQRGIFDSPRPPKPVFSLKEINQLAPAIQRAFHMARSTEWLSFYLSDSSDSQMTVTSGGLFIKNGRLHIVIANHQEPASATDSDVAQIRTNPIRSLRGTRGTLRFESSRFAIGTEANWSGGHAAAASELVIDQQAFLAFLRIPSTTLMQPTATLLPVELPQAPPATNQATSKNDPGPKDPLLKLQEEIDRLKRRVEEQESEIAKLRQPAKQPLPPRPKPKKSAILP
jgi:hypothetical protein